MLLSLLLNSAKNFALNNKMMLFKVACLTLWSIGCVRWGIDHNQAQVDAKNLASIQIVRGIEHSDVKTAFEIGSGYEKDKLITSSGWDIYINSLQPGNDAVSGLPIASGGTNETACNNRLLIARKRQAETDADLKICEDQSKQLLWLINTIDGFAENHAAK